MDGIIHALAPLKLLDIIRLYLHRPAQIAVGEPGAGKKSDFNAFCRTPRCLAGRHCIIKHHLNPSTLPSIPARTKSEERPRGNRFSQRSSEWNTVQQYPTSEFDPPASGYEKSSRFEHPCRKKSPYYEDWFLIHMRSHVLMLSRLIVLHILSVSLTRICSGAAGDSAASPHSSLPGKIISGEANGKHPAILQDISAVYLTSPKHFYKARRY